MRRMNRFALGLLSGCAAALWGCWDFDALVPRASTDMTSPQVIQDLATPDLLCQRNPQVEDCSNGVDDNGDCRIDCEDDDCKRSEACKITALGVLTASSGVTMAPACENGQSASGPVMYQGIDSNSKSCSGCDCNSPTCTVPKVTAFANNMTLCQQGGATAAQNLATGTCVATNPAPAAGSFFYVEAPRQACSPKAASGTVAPAFQQRAQLCQPAANQGCQFLDCVKREAGAKLCLAFATDPAYCPAPFTRKVTDWQRSYNDGRTCACSCTPPAASCAGIVTAFGKDNKCGTDANSPSVDLSAQCAAGPVGMGNMPTSALSLKSSYAPVAGAACTPVGTVNGNTPTLSGGVVLCCEP